MHRVGAYSTSLGIWLATDYNLESQQQLGESCSSPYVTSWMIGHIYLLTSGREVSRGLADPGCQWMLHH